MAGGIGSAHSEVLLLLWPGASVTSQPLDMLLMAPSDTSVYLSCFSLPILCSSIFQVSHALFSGLCSCYSLDLKQSLPLLLVAKYHHLSQFGSNITSFWPP